MKYGKDEGAGAWVITADGTITVSEYMIAEHKKWAERARDGHDADANMPMFVAEMLKILQAFAEVLPSYQRLQQSADRQYDDGDLAS